MLTALLLLLAHAEPSGRAYNVRDFASISPAGVDALDGMRVLVRVERDSREEQDRQRPGFDCQGPNRDDGLHRTCPSSRARRSAGY